ncbi:similar to Kazachstania africana KAFR_0C01950 hypothetical protein [Maudiozyma barnettii]|uniref:Pre-mRNA-splicing factor SYF2 n=1 Tax=Maudiozyma barnettii TaxID=61262 RepID=A0A8H2ZF66_9SACH|nr:uncharacterized protein KABA2_01S03916 [Kazachstania barnettii]CAB4252010.1 similar to Kazachstania africana KAFR_0C01950 hypothetical protein [Kazachstania barnettii]CAD1778437.1 similar to Kazachstania africana KAFR_0C01950 hypothetical protein [Kazachstania barnettii]
MNFSESRKLFKELRRKCKDIEIDDRKLVEIHQKPLVYSAKDLGEEEDDINKDQLETIGADIFNTPLYEFEARIKEKVDKSNDTLAKKTYDKEIKDIKKFKISENEKSDKLDELVNHLNSKAKKRYKVLKKKTERDEQFAGGFINDRNRQFNSKLNKERQNEGS